LCEFRRGKRVGAAGNNGRIDADEAFRSGYDSSIVASDVKRISTETEDFTAAAERSVGNGDILIWTDRFNGFPDNTLLGDQYRQGASMLLQTVACIYERCKAAFAEILFKNDFNIPLIAYMPAPSEQQA